MRTYPLLLCCMLLIWACLGGGFSPLAYATVPMRAVIVFDTSGSMQKNDPHRLSHVAAQLFLDLMQPQDHVGLVSFSDASVPLFPLTPMTSPVTAQPLRLMLRALRFDGQTTHLGAALEAGLQSFPQDTSQESRNLVLLLTDGQLDLGRQRRADEPVVLEHIRERLLPQYKARGIAVYTIAFTEGADQALLQEMAQATAGEFRFIQSASRLHKAFGDLFVVAKQAESLPIDNGAVRLDASIQEASLVLSKPTPHEPIGLVTPQQKRLDATSRHPGVDWQATPSFDRVRLTQPEPGTWQIERASPGNDDLAIIGASTLWLAVRLTPDYLETEESLMIHAWFVEQEQPLRHLQRLAEFTVQADIDTPEGQRHTVPLLLQDSGEFRASFPIPAVSGQYGVSVLASSPTIRRQRTISFVPQPRCFVPSVNADPPVTVTVRLTIDCPMFHQLEFTTRYAAANDEAQDAGWVPLISNRPRLFQATLPQPTGVADHAVVIRIQGRRDPNPAFTVLKGPYPLPDLPPQEVDWWALGKTVGFQLLCINAVLGVLAGGGYGVYRTRRHARRGADG